MIYECIFEYAERAKQMYLHYNENSRADILKLSELYGRAQAFEDFIYREKLEDAYNEWKRIREVNKR